jgi:DNA-binding GntR family transcriptional regulator
MATTAETKADRVYHAIRGMIASGQLPAGSVLDEAVLAARHQVSRTPIREAIRSLAKEGLVVAGPRRQMTVVDVSAPRREEIVLLRAALETAAAPAACEHATSDDLDRLELLVIKQSRRAEAGDSAEFLELDEQFHKSLADLAQLPTLSRFLDQLGPFVRLVRIQEETPPAHMLALVTEHRRILDLLRSGDPGQLQRALDQHIRSTANRA